MTNTLNFSPAEARRKDSLARLSEKQKQSEICYEDILNLRGDRQRLIDQGNRFLEELRRHSAQCETAQTNLAAAQKEMHDAFLIAYPVLTFPTTQLDRLDKEVSSQIEILHRAEL